MSFEINTITTFFDSFNKYSNEVSNFRCPISATLILEPVFIVGEMCGDMLRGYDRTFILSWLNKAGTSPFTRIETHKDKVMTHTELAKKIVNYVEMEMQKIQPSRTLTWTYAQNTIDPTQRIKLHNHPDEKWTINRQNNYCGFAKGFLS